MLQEHGVEIALACSAAGYFSLSLSLSVVTFVILSGGSTLLVRGVMDSFLSHPQVFYDDGITPTKKYR
jgi:membrane protein implicated in regulation of membrane protease activity